MPSGKRESGKAQRGLHAAKVELMVFLNIMRLTLAVGVIAILNEIDGPMIILGKQYRPPCETVCIELPAGEIPPLDYVYDRLN